MYIVCKNIYANDVIEGVLCNLNEFYRNEFASLRIYYTQLNYENIQEVEDYGVSVKF